MDKLRLLPSRIKFSLESLTESDAVPSVMPWIDGTRLSELITAFEREYGFDPAGGYAGVVPRNFNYGPLLDYYLGKIGQQGYWSELGGIYLLGCTCGEVGCGPLVCQVITMGRVVTWTRFRQPQRPNRDYSNFGPFAFDYEEYSLAVSEAIHQLANEDASQSALP